MDKDYTYLDYILIQYKIKQQTNIRWNIAISITVIMRCRADKLIFDGTNDIFNFNNGNA